MCRKYWLAVLAIVILVTDNRLYAQKKSIKKYPSLFWEITGNGLAKPSYLFGTMHVSSKMVFHLSDSFYNALSGVDAVALELNPEIWQEQMVRMDKLKNDYSSFVQNNGGDYLNENSFRINKYENALKAALSTEPTIVNSLLYRTYKNSEDFEEDTFLDLYIFQTGKKLGKRGTGVENYYETEKIVLQAYADMAKEKKKKNRDMDGESMRDIGVKMQEAYRNGDLDLMDSLETITDQSPAFRELFLYKRNEIQAASMDSIMKKSSLFVGVGAAHLAGNRGVIELLRKKGYTLRPIKMSDRDAAMKEATDKLRVPVNFTSTQSEDGFLKVDVPGALYKMSGDFKLLDRLQYSDMNNGSYYLVTRVKTHAAFTGQNEEMVKKKIDSLLYENIPGKILKKTAIQKSGYSGYDITNKTRRGDLQRYNIFITPFEVIFFKMSGKENYVDGAEAEHFFSSIQLKEADNSSLLFSPKQGGFAITLPQTPLEYMNTSTSDGIDRWEYEAVDKTTGNAYTIFKKSVYNFKFLDEDSFELKLAEESFRSPEYFERQLHRKLTAYNGYPCLDVKEKMKDSSVVNARFIIKGPHYYVLAMRSKNKNADPGTFFNSFKFTPYQYSSNKMYIDTFSHFLVNTPVAPEIDQSYRAILEKMTEDAANGMTNNSYNNGYWPKVRNAMFSSDSTGEKIGVSVQKYPQYFYVKDSVNYWKNEINDFYNENDPTLYSKEYFKIGNNVSGYKFSLRDTGSSKMINRMILLKDNYLFSMVSLTDTLSQQSSFIHSFFSSFAPEEKKLGRDIFVNCLDSFFADLFSKDSSTHAKALQSLSNIHYGEKGVPKIMNAINRLSPGDKDYYDTKIKLIQELGYIKDTTKPIVVDQLKKLYLQTTDTSAFQNEVMEALARHKTANATALFKELLLQDPPVFDNNYDYSSLLNHFKDSLELAVSLYPDILQLLTLDDYKTPVFSLLVDLVDSGFVKAPQYESYFSKIYFDAKIALKKQLATDEKKKQAELKKGDDEDNSRIYSYNNNNRHQKSDLDDYAILLMPFYDKNNSIPKFFEKLLYSKDENLQLNTAILLLKNKKTVSDSILTAMASKDKLRGKLFASLEEIKRLDKFPAKYKTQLDLARSYLVADKDFNKIDSVVFITRQTAGYDDKKGLVYFFKYRVKKDDDWKIGISGLQPLKSADVSSDDKLSTMTNKKLKEDKPENEQLQEQLKKILFNFHKSAKNFFQSGGYMNRYQSFED